MNLPFPDRYRLLRSKAFGASIAFETVTTSALSPGSKYGEEIILYCFEEVAEICSDRAVAYHGLECML